MGNLLKAQKRFFCYVIVFTTTFFVGINLFGDDKLAIMKVNRVGIGVWDHGPTWQKSPNYTAGWFPADYNCIGFNNNYGNSTGPTTIAIRNFYGPNVTTVDNVSDTTWDVWPYYTLSCYGSSWDTAEVVIQPMTNYIRWDLPDNYVNNENRQIKEHWAVVDPTKMVGTSDQVISVSTRNYWGIEVHRKLFAWSQQFHDNYVICDYKIVNKTGVTLDTVYLQMNDAAFNIFRAQGRNPELPSGQGPAAHHWAHYYGSRPGDTLRIFYEYSADDPERPGDQMAHPVYSQDGRLSQPDMEFIAFLHVSEKPYSDPQLDVDDPKQPTVTAYYNHERVHYEAVGDLPGYQQGQPGGSYGIIAGYVWKDQLVDDRISGTYHRKNNDEMGNPDYSCLGNGFDKNHIWNRRWVSIGPYEKWHPGDTIHIVYAVGFASLSLKKAKEIGEKWLNGTLQDPPNLPDPRTGYFPTNFAFPIDATEMDKIKDRWYSTVIDSIHKTVSRAKWNFEHNWQVPMAPPPTNQYILGTGRGVEISWSNQQAENLPNFAGYRIMRSVGYRDTVFFEEVYRSGPEDKAEEHHWVDTTVVFGATYYYYVQAGVRIDENDPYAYPANRGKVIWGGRLFSTTYNPVESKRPVGKKLSDIRIVPNPYNIRDPLWNNYGLPNLDDPRRIMFFNLPEECTIRIYTENLDLVKVIEHKPDPVSSGFEIWDMLTENQQAIASGIYIVVFQTPDGKVAYQKLIVVR